MPLSAGAVVVTLLVMVKLIDLVGVRIHPPGFASCGASVGVTVKGGSFSGDVESDQMTVSIDVGVSGRATPNTG